MVRKIEISKNFLIKNYVKLGKTPDTIAKDIGCSVGPIYRCLKEFKIPKRVPKDFSKKEFGYLKVVKLGGRNKWQQKLWICRCVCGKEVEVRGYNLVGNRIKSCGCKRIRDREFHKNWKGYKEITGRKWNRIKKSAIKRKLVFNIDIKYAWNLYVKQNKKCALTGRNIGFAITNSEQEAGKGTASLDRINNKNGYIKGNVQWVHKDINWLKQDFDEDYFIKMCEDVVKHRNNKNEQELYCGTRL